MPRRTRNQRAQGRRQLNRPKRQNRKQNKYPTHSQGASAQGELLRRIPIFGKASHRTRLPYYEYQLSRSSTAGAIATYFFSANGMFDPNITGTGHQPMGFDTMMLYYEQATVVRSKIAVTFMSNGVQASRIAVSLTPDTTAPVIGELVENGEIKLGFLDGYANQASNGSGYGVGNRLKTLSLNCDVASYFGRRSYRELLDDPSLYTTAAANPTEQVYFAVSTWGGFTNDNGSVQFDVIISYDCIFWEPRKLSQQLTKQVHEIVVQETKHFAAVPVVTARRPQRR